MKAKIIYGCEIFRHYADDGDIDILDPVENEMMHLGSQDFYHAGGYFISLRTDLIEQKFPTLKVFRHGTTTQYFVGIELVSGSSHEETYAIDPLLSKALGFQEDAVILVEKFRRTYNLQTKYFQIIEHEN